MLNSRPLSPPRDGESAVEAAVSPGARWARSRPASSIERWRGSPLTPTPRRPSRLAQRGADLVFDTSHRITRSLRLAGDSGARLIRDRPYGAVLLAAATGAALVALGWQIAIWRSRR